jgi:hypothetical protein
VISSNELGAKTTTARKITIIGTVLKKTFGFTLANQDAFLEGINPPFYILINVTDRKVKQNIHRR